MEFSYTELLRWLANKIKRYNYALHLRTPNHPELRDQWQGRLIAYKEMRTLLRDMRKADETQKSADL